MTSFLPQFWERFKSSFELVEKNVTDHSNSYKGLFYEALYTSQEDLDLIFNSPHIYGTFLDLGCGQGHSVLYYSHLFPTRTAIGIEFQKSRIDFARKIQKEFNIHNAHFLELDLLDSSIPVADTYLLYFPTGHVLDRVLNELYKGMNSFNLVVIESHGDLFKRINKENWLEPVVEIPLNSLRQFPNAIIYKRMFVERSNSLVPFQHSFKEHFLIISENDLVWIGETFGMEWLRDDTFNLIVPPRSFDWKNVKKLIAFEDFDPLTRFILSLRRNGDLSFYASNTVFIGTIRKIFISPIFMIEISTGQRIEWNEIDSIYQGSQKCYDSSYVV